MRYDTKAIDARRGAQPMFLHWQALQRRRHAFVSYPEGAALPCAQGVVAHRLFGITKPRGSRLALRTRQAVAQPLPTEIGSI